MPFIAVCPHCRASKFRAPYRKRGTFVTCPRCRHDFLLIPPSTAATPAVEYRVPPFESAGPPTLPVAADVTAPAPVAPIPIPPPCPAAPPRPADRDYPLRLALAAAGLFGAAVVAGQFPYGQYTAGPVAGVGVILAGLSLLGLERRRWVGWAGTGLNAAALLLALTLPDWLGIPVRIPSADPEAGPKPVTAVGRDGTPACPADWVDARTAVWEQGDVRVAVTSVAVGPGAKPDRRLSVGLRVTNVGVARAVGFDGWPTPPSLTTAGGRPLRVSPAAGPAAPAVVLPGKSTDTVLAFALPAGPADDLRLELPAGAFGGTDPVRFRIPRAMIPAR